ncbi:hypothetical protein KIN20_027481 [Parelaphostrongylus tenuis]|uniref:Uncharacterized protein n=1 Tax=Parelaphostrongylus tenuis TaxID=148309 RepID=A0AAD5WDZ6_PARTN|nr:hypothetical protein KIN20_027481 [Parelaphostrongylus tenuis]
MQGLYIDDLLRTDHSSVDCRQVNSTVNNEIVLLIRLLKRLENRLLVNRREIDLFWRRREGEHVVFATQQA